MGQAEQTTSSIADWRPHLSIGVTGHREGNAAFAANRAAVKASIDRLLRTIDELARKHDPDASVTRLHCLLADGVDQIAAECAFALGWDLVAPLPFGADLNIAINAVPLGAEDAARLCEGKPALDPQVEARASSIRAKAKRALLFELADRDAEMRTLFEAMLASPEDPLAAQAFDALCSEKVANAGQVMIERVDFVIAVWDYKDNHHRGGTGHTVSAALAMGTPVLVIDPARPDQWSVYSKPEELGQSTANSDERLNSMIASAFESSSSEIEALRDALGKTHSRFWFGFYRAIEQWFGKSPEAVSTSPDHKHQGTALDTSMHGLIEAAASNTQLDPPMVEQLNRSLAPTFESTDTISTALSDAYRSSMCYNFVLAALAVVVGVLYLPLKLDSLKWAFASVELFLLCGIIAITVIGKRRGWHRRWFETRRAAEYLRHSPAMLMLGVARPVGRWPRGEKREWPEQYARHLLRNIGLPRMALDAAYLRQITEQVIRPHVTSQRDYHRIKAGRLSRVHHGLDRAAQACFFLGVLSVTAYLSLKLGSTLNIIPDDWPDATSKLFTFLGVAFPTLGANLAGIRFFGDFERFASISRLAAVRLDEIAERLALMLSSDEKALNYRSTADLVRALDEAVIDEIAGWQSVFGAKHLDLPA